MPVGRFSSLLVVVSLIAAAALADEAAKPALSPELQKLIEQLDADDFDDRASASEQLAKLGKDALPALEEGVRSSSPEVATRSFDLLQQMLEKGNEAAKVAAKTSLDKLAQGSDRVADQARKMLEPKPVPMDPNDPTGRVRILGGGAIRIIAGPRIVRAPLPIAPAIEDAPVRKGMVISTSINSDGVKTINVDEDGKKFKVVEDPKKGIEGEYTETKEGKEATVKFAAKDADELKTRHPDAFKLYERFAKGGGVVARVAVPAELLPARIADPRFKSPAEFAGRAPAAPATREQVEESLKDVEKQIEKSAKEVEAARSAEDPRVDVLVAVLDSQTQLRDRYKEQLKQLVAKEEQVPKKSGEPKEPAGIDVKDLKLEIEVK